MKSMSVTTAEGQGEDVTDSQQEKQRTKSVQSETNTSSDGKLEASVHCSIQCMNAECDILVLRSTNTCNLSLSLFLSISPSPSQLPLVGD